MTSASSSSKNFVVPSVRTSPLDTDNPVARIARLAGAKSQLERCFVHIGGEYASSNERSLVWRKMDAAFESRILTGTVINSNHIEPRRFLEDAENALERVRDAVERHGSVKVNTVFNGEFATKNKRKKDKLIKA